MQREILYSDHEFYSFGVFPKLPIEFTTLPDTTRKSLGFSNFEGIYSLRFFYNLDFIEHQRQIYSPLDFLGDVGGLADALMAIGSIVITIMQLVFGNPLTKYMIQSIFERDNSCESASDSNSFALKLLS